MSIALVFLPLHCQNKVEYHNVFAYDWQRMITKGSKGGKKRAQAESTL